MSWTPPFFTCGECGGEIGRWPHRNLLQQVVLDWRHRSVPPGVAEHRAVLGTPAHKPRIVDAKAAAAVIEEDEDVVDLSTCPPPVVPARPALRDDLPNSAISIDKLADANGWTVQAWYWHGTRITAHWRPNKMVESVCLRMVRDGHGLVVCWEREDGKLTEKGEPKWALADAYSVTHTVDPIGSPELRRLLAEPRARCETCGEPPALHVWTKSGLICHADWQELHTAQEATHGTDQDRP